MPDETRTGPRRTAGGVGQAAAGLTVEPASRSQAKAAMRSAVKKFGRPRPASDTDADDVRIAKGDATAAGRRADRAAQALLGRLRRPPGDFDEAGLAEWLKQMSGDELKALGRLVWAARQDKDDAKPGLGRVERQLSQQGVHLDIKAQTVTVNVATPAAAPAARDPRPPGLRDPRAPTRRATYADWGRQWGRLKDFINGH